MKIFKAILILLSSFLFSCSTENPFVPKEVVDELLAARNPFRYSGDFAAIINNDIYYFDHIDSIPRRITNTPEEIKTDLKLSDDKTKMVYLDQNKSPVIIDDNGNTIESLSNLIRVKQMGWVNNDKTIYFLIGNKVEFYGEQISVMDPITYTQSDVVKSFSINNKGDQAYVIHTYYRNYDMLQFYSAEEDIDTLMNSLNDEYSGLSKVEFVGDDGNFILGYSTNVYNQNEINKVYVHTNYNFYSAENSWEYDLAKFPSFNSESEVLLCEFRIGDISYIKAVYLGHELYYGDGYHEIKSKMLDDYPSNSGIYVDW